MRSIARRRTSWCAIPAGVQSAAAFILSERGFDAYVLKGGITTSSLPMRRAGLKKRSRQAAGKSARK